MDVTRTSNAAEILSTKNGVRPADRKTSNHFSEMLTAAIKETQPEKATSARTEPIQYIVRKGDTLWKIGKEQFKVDPYQIARDNGLANPNMIRPGQKLIINPAPPLPVHAKVSGEVTASWYGQEYHNKQTASGQRFDMYQNTLAHKTLPLGTKVRLVNPDNGKSVEGVVNDRGPYIKGREVDVSYAIAKQLGFVKKGVTKLNIEEI
jgi:rare lipoprotein A